MTKQDSTSLLKEVLLSSDSTCSKVTDQFKVFKVPAKQTQTLAIATMTYSVACNGQCRLVSTFDHGQQYSLPQTWRDASNMKEMCHKLDWMNVSQNVVDLSMNNAQVKRQVGALEFKQMTHIGNSFKPNIVSCND